MIRKICAASAAIMLTACTPAPQTNSTGHGMIDTAMLDIPDVAPGNISIATMKEVTATLSSDHFEGRAPGTPGEEKTLAYLVQQFTAAGLQPGNKGSWFQDVPLAEVTAANYAPLIVKGGNEDLSFTFAADWVGVSYREADHIELAGNEMVFVGYGINAPEKGWNDYADIDMRGKIAVMLVNDPDYKTVTNDGLFNGRTMTYYGRWDYKFQEAARQGAVAALIVHDTFPAAYGWNVVREGWSGPQAYAQRADGGADQTKLNGWIQKGVAAKLLASAGHSLASLSAAAKRKGFKPVPLGLTASTSFDNKIRRFASKNVVGILPGSQRADEYVLYSAHWDHLGRCTPDKTGDNICNGAIDNATGTAALVALAQAHGQAGPPARSMVFLALTAEEQGLLGSEYYGSDPVFPLSQTVGGVNMDALYPTGPARDVKVIGGGKSQLDAYLAKALVAEGRTASPDPNPERGYYYRSDHFSFAKRGVPMLYVEAGEDLVDGGKPAGAAYAADYTDNRYHQPADEYDESWDWSGIALELQLHYRLGRMMAESKGWPNWLEGDEFRRIRDESCKDEGGC